MIGDRPAAPRPRARFEAVELVRSKRDGDELTRDEIDWLIDAYVSGEVADEQVAAFLMAVFLRGMTSRELAFLTGAMVASGRSHRPIRPVPAQR